MAIGAGSVANVANTVSVGAVGNERKIVNVAAGTLTAGSTDAVNGGQLLTANQRVAAAFGGGAGLDVNGQLTAPSYTIQGTVYSDVGSAFTAVNTNSARWEAAPTYYKANSTGPAARPRAPTRLPWARMRKGAALTRSPSVQCSGDAVRRDRDGHERGVDRRQRYRHRHQRARHRLGGGR